jgi:ATP-dependent RNA helicase DeaD
MSIETVLRFAQLGLPAPILQAIDEVGYETPSPIQAQSIPPMIEGRDLLGQAQTGTGKTAAFALPILCRVDPYRRSTQALVLTPTRELAIQVAEAIHAYGRHLDGLHVLPIYGGQHIGAQLRPLQRGVHVVVGTPGRILDHLERGTLKLDAIETVVLDEADEMLRMGFIEDVNRILEQTPDTKQVALFSATMPSEVRRIADRHLKDPEVIAIEAATTTVATVEQRYLITPWRQKLDAMTRILETTDFNAMRGAERRHDAAPARTNRATPARRLPRHRGRDRRRGPRPRREPDHPRRELRHPERPRSVRPPHRAHRAGRP